MYIREGHADIDPTDPFGTLRTRMRDPHLRTEQETPPR